MISVAVDLGGTRIKMALIRDGGILQSRVLQLEAGADLRRGMQAVEQVIMEWLPSCEETPFGIGIAFAGLLNPIEKRVVSVNGKYLDAPGFDFGAWSQEKFGLPLVLENDANSALLGEVHYGCAKGFNDAVIMILGTGVGTAAMINGRLIRGKHFQAGCLGGHFTVSENGRLCTCGSRGCVEANASTWALPLIAREQPDFDRSGLASEEKIDFLALEKWVLRGDTVAVRLLDWCNDCWSAGIKNLIHAYDPEVVILSGGVLKCGDMIIKPLTEKVKSSVWTPWGEVAVRVAQNPEHSVLLGVHHSLERERKAEYDR